MDIAADYPSLEGRSPRIRRLGAGQLLAGCVSPSGATAEPRSYVHDDADGITLFTGLPVDPSGAVMAHRASELAEYWEGLPARLEGKFALIKATAEPAGLQIHTDLLGYEHVFYRQYRGGWVFSNSVALVERLTGPCGLDSSAIALHVSMGWVSGNHTLLQDISVLPPAASVRWQSDSSQVQIESRPVIAGLCPPRRHRLSIHDAKPIADEMILPLTVLSQNFGPLDCPLTGGRDSRVNFSLLTHGGMEARYYTFGSQQGDDARIAAELAAQTGQHHEFLETSSEDLIAQWDQLSREVSRRADGMYPLQALVAYLTAKNNYAGHLPVRISGDGGAISKGSLQPGRFSVNWKTEGGSRALIQSRMANAYRGLVTPSGKQLVREFVDQRVNQFLADGIPAQDVPDAFMAYERVARRGGKVMRATAAWRDSFSPFCTRAFLKASFSMPPRQKLTEPLHRLLIQHLAPEIFDMPFDDKAPQWKPDQAWRILLRGSLDYYGTRAARLLRRRRKRKPAVFSRDSMFDRGAWLEQRRDLALKRCLDVRDSAIWEVINRPMFESLMDPKAAPEGRMRLAKPLYHLWAIAEYEYHR